jgi:very-short-patch-repair endonuclease
MRLAIEVEGGTWAKGGGRHNRGTGFEKDAEKYNTAALAGWIVLRFTGNMIKSGLAIQQIQRAFEVVA